MRITLDIPLDIKEVITAVNGRYIGILKDSVSYGISTDSRNIKDGDLFFAISGENFDGEDFVFDVFYADCVPVTAKHECGIRVENTIKALGSLASFYKTKLKHLKYTIAITGSVGKTTTKEFLKILLKEKYKVHATKDNLNNCIGLPLTILSAPYDTEVLILEMGMNHRGEISALSKYSTPDIAIVTNIGTAHIGNLGSRENIAAAKLEVLQGMTKGRLIVPSEEPLLLRKEKYYTFSSSDRSADIYIIYNEGNVKGITPKGTFDTTLSLSASYTADCLAAAVSAAVFCEADLNNIKRGISLISDKNTRQNIFQLGYFYILSDFYNSSYESVISALSYLKSLEKYTEKSALIGSILELGDMSPKIHLNIGKACAKVDLRKLYIYGEYGEYVKEGALSYGMDEKKIFLNTDASSPAITADQIFYNTKKGEIILFKASHKVGLSQIIKLLKDKF